MQHELSPRECIIKTVEKNPNTAFKYAYDYEKYFGKEPAEQLLLGIAKENGILALAYYPDYKKLPHAEEILSTGIEQLKGSPEPLLKYADVYNILPNSDKIFTDALNKAIETNQDYLILKYVDKFDAYPIAEDKVREVAIKDVGIGDYNHYREFLSNLPNYERHPWIHDLVLEVAEKDPLIFMAYANKIRDFPDAEQIIEQTLEKFTPDSYYVNQNYGQLLEDYPNYKDYPNGNKVLELSLQKALNLEGSKSVLQNSKNFISEPWTYSYINNAAMNDPENAIIYFDNYKLMPGAEEILKNAVETAIDSTYSGDIIKYSKNIVQFGWADRYLEESAEKNPELALTYYKDYSNTEAAADILERSVLACSKKDSNAVLDNVSYFAADKWAVDPISYAINNNPDKALKIAAETKFYKANKRYPKLLKSATEKASSLYILEYLNDCEDIGNLKWRSELTRNAVENDPYSGLIFYNKYKGLPNSQEWFIDAAKRIVALDPNKIMDSDISKNLLYSEEGRTVLQIAINDPAMTDTKKLLQNFWVWDVLGGNYGAIENAVLNNPEETTDILEKQDSAQSIKLQYIISQSTSPNLRAMLRINLGSNDQNAAEINRIASVLLINNPSLEYTDAVNIARNDNKLLNSLVALKYSSNAYGIDDIKRLLAREITTIIDRLNSLHESPDSIRFNSVMGMSPLELYTLITYGGDEAYTSTYDGLFNIFIKQLKKNNESPEMLFESVGYDRFRAFIKLAATYNRLHEFFSISDPVFAQEILQRFAENIEKEKNPFSEAVAVADTFAATNSERVKGILQQTIRNEYTRAQASDNEKAKIVYGLLEGMFGDGTDMNRLWSSGIASKYNLSYITKIPSSKLFNSNNINVQEYFFFPDTDGKASFADFLSKYRDRRFWSIEDYGDYIRIASPENGLRRVEIFANKPETGEAGIITVQNALKKDNLNASVVVHRGHSYYTDITIAHIPKTAMVVYLGSCGGYNDISAILKKAPEASIIATKGKGTMYVNDPLLKMLNEQIISGNDIDWPAFWAEAEKRVGRNPNFNNYVPPYMNMSVLLFKMYDNLYAQNGSMLLRR